MCLIVVWGPPAYSGMNGIALSLETNRTAKFQDAGQARWCEDFMSPRATAALEATDFVPWELEVVTSCSSHIDIV